VQRFDLGSRKKDRITKKSQKCHISPTWGEAPTGLMQPKSCTVGDVHDVITCAKFQTEIFMGYDFTGGQFSIFLLIFVWASQQCIDVHRNCDTLYITAPTTVICGSH